MADSLFFEIQPIITDADIQLTKDEDVIATRDTLWRNLLETITAKLQQMLAEEIELAYVDLYTYDPKVRELFHVAIDRLRMINDQTVNELLGATQTDVLSFRNEPKADIHSAVLGNKLRGTAARLRSESQRARDAAIVPFQRESTRLIDATNECLFRKEVRLNAPAEVFKSPMAETE